MSSTERSSKLLLGVDGGGTKTDAMLAALDEDGRITELARAQSGPSNLRLSGRELALASLDEAVGQVLQSGGLGAEKVDFAVLALAGSTDPDVHRELEQWARQSGYFQRFAIIHDAEPVLIAGTPDGHGIALIVGTGSVATGVDRAGRASTCGGWGHWFGDSGSGFDIGRRALAAAAEIDDGVGRDSVIHQRILEHFRIAKLRSVMQVLATSLNVRQSMATVARVVMQAADEGDALALEILSDGADRLARTVQSVTQSLNLEDGYSIAMAGSVVCKNRRYRDMILGRLEQQRPAPGQAVLVPEPVWGCLEIARRRFLEQRPPSEQED